MGVFRKEASVELVKISVKESSQSNHLSTEPPFLRAKAPPANRDRWNNREPALEQNEQASRSCKMATILNLKDEER